MAAFAPDVLHGDQLDMVLSGLLQSNNEIIHQAEATLTQSTKNPGCVVAMVDRIVHSGNEGIRHLAAVIMQRKVHRHWGRLTPEQQLFVKTTLLQRLIAEPHSLVRRGISGLVGSVAKQALPAGQWPELLPFLFECSQSQASPEHREAALRLFVNLGDSIPDQILEHAGALQSIFHKALGDSAPAVRRAALVAVARMVQMVNFDNGPVKFDPAILPAVVAVAQQCLTAGDEDDAITAFEIMDELVERQAPAVKVNVNVLVPFVLQTAAHTAFELSTRERALDVIAWLSTYSPRLIYKNPDLLTSTMQTVLSLLCEKHDPEDEDTPANVFALSVLDKIATGFPSRMLMPMLGAFATENIASSTAERRRGAISALGIATEGCREQMTENLAEMVPMIVRGASDSDPIVRTEACSALGLCAEYLQPEIIEHHAIVVPALGQALHDPSPDVLRFACIALEAFTENLEEQIIQYLPQLIGKLLEVATKQPGLGITEHAISAVGSSAGAAQEHFLPYFDGTVEFLKTLLVQTDDEMLTLRARATDCLGVVCASVGRATSDAAVQASTPQVLAGMDLDFAELREYSYGYFSTVAEMIGADFGVYLPKVMEYVLKSLDSDDGMVPMFEGSGNDGYAFNIGDSDDDDDDQDGPLHSFSVRTALLDEKSAAVHAVGVLAEKCSLSMQPFLEASWNATMKNVGYFHEDVRGNAVTALRQLVACSFRIFTVPMRQAAAAQGGADAFGLAQTALANETKVLYENVMTKYLEIMEKDTDKEVVARVFENLEKMPGLCEPGLLAPYMDELTKNFVKFLKQDAVCQAAESDDEDDDEDHDEILIDAVADCIGEFARALSINFVPYFNQIFALLQKYLRPRRSDKDRYMAMGCIGEVVHALGPASGPYFEAMLPQIWTGLADKNDGLCRNSAFCLGSFCEALSSLMSAEQIAAFYPHALTLLHPLMVNGDRLAETRDNACAAVCRMTLGAPASMPIEQILPVVVGMLPLAGDKGENGIVAKFFITLLNNNPQQVSAHVPAIVRFFGQLLADLEYRQELKNADVEEIQNTMKALMVQFPEAMQQVVSQMPEAWQRCIAVDCAAP